MTRIHEKLHQWFPDRVRLAWEGTDGAGRNGLNATAQVFNVDGQQFMALTLFENGKEVGCDTFKRCGEMTWESVRESIQAFLDEQARRLP